jgi:hypothetical protein
VDVTVQAATHELFHAQPDPDIAAAKYLRSIARTGA